MAFWNSPQRFWRRSLIREPRRLRHTPLPIRFTQINFLEQIE